MAVVYSVAITSGVPSSGTGEVATINEFLSAPGTPNSTSVITVQYSTTLNSSNNPIVVGLVSTSAGVTTLGQATMVNSLPVTMASNQTGFPVFPSPTTTGGLLFNSAILSTASSGTGTLVSSRATQLYKIEGFNVSSLPAFGKLYNLSSTPTTGSTATSIFFTVPCNTAGAGIVTEYSNGVTFGTGLGYTVTSSMSSSDVTALSAPNAISITIYYK